MTWLEAVIVALYTLSAAFPLAGLLGLYRAARERLKRLSRGVDPEKFDKKNWVFNDFLDVLSDDIIHGPGRVLSDFILIGGGIVAGAVAGILSLFV